jgi:hypothetical protein
MAGKTATCLDSELSGDLAGERLENNLLDFSTYQMKCARFTH